MQDLFCLAMFPLNCLIWTQLLLITESSSGDNELLPRLFPSGSSNRIAPSLRNPRQQQQQQKQQQTDDVTPPKHLHLHLNHHLKKHNHAHRLSIEDMTPPAAILETRFLEEPVFDRRGTLNLLARTHHHRHHHRIQEVTPEHSVVSPRHLVTVYLGVDVRRLNVSLLRWFREGVAAALGVSPGHIHINRINEEKNGIELFVSSDRSGASEPRPAEEIVQSLNIRILHRHLGHFGITEVSTEKNVLQGEQKDQVWNREGFYSAVLFLTLCIIIITCLMVLYRLKEKVLYRLKEKVSVCDRQVIKAPPPHPRTPGHTDRQRTKGTQVVYKGSMVQAELPPVLATPLSLQQPITACRRLAPPTPLPSPASFCPVVDSNDQQVPIATSNELKPCPSPFRMKSAAGLQERRGSNVSLVLDMSALGSVEPLSETVVTPREAAAREYLLSATRPLTPELLTEVVRNTPKLHAEFAEIPMNFIDPKDLDIPNYGPKNRYKTILPNPHSRVILKSKSSNDLLSSYINANYLRGYHGDQKAFIATQGPMVNTVNDFWQMVWQEEAPVIVMITKLKEKNEKCVLYWPEKRGIYGKVEVLVNSIRECEHYTTRSLTLKCGNQTRCVQHYWYTSWPDHKTPDSASPLLQLMTDTETDRREAVAMGPVIVHCSAGIGRTGCFIAVTIGCRQLKQEGVVDVLSITCQLRADRGGMIQTCEQYEFVHHALSLYQSHLSAETGQ